MNEWAELVQANWILIGAVVLVLLVALWLLRRGSSAPRTRSHRPDVLDEGQAPAARNQALIDAPPAAQVPPIVPAPPTGTLAGVGEVIAVAAQDAVEEAALSPEPQPEPQPEPEPEPAPAAPAAADDLARIKGLGPKLQALLPTLGITTFAQIAAMTEADLAELDGKLGAFAGRPKRDSWVEQAQYLAAGDVAGFEARFGKV